MKHSAHEGTPQIGLQAMATGTPIIGSNVGGIPEIVEADRNGLIVPPSDAEALADGMVAALDHREASGKRAVAGLAAVRKSHSHDHMLDRLEGIYRRHIKKDGGAHPGQPCS